MKNKKKLLIWVAIILVIVLGLVLYFSTRPQTTLSPTTSQDLSVQQLSRNFINVVRPYVNTKNQKWGPLTQGLSAMQVATADDNSWPKVTDVSVDPTDVHVGDTQNMRIVLQDTVPLKSVIAEIETDNGTTTVPLEQTSVSAVTQADYTSRPYFVRNGILNIANDQNRQLALPDKVKPLLAQNIPPSLLPVAMAQGNVLQRYTYEGSWVVHDTIVKTYHTVFIFTDVNGRTNKTTLAWSDPCSGLPGPGCGSSCNGVLSASCTLGPGARDGVDNGNFSFGPSNFTLTLSQFATPYAGALFEWNPGQTVTINNGGQILIGSGAQLSKYYLFFQDADGDTYPSQNTDSVPLTTVTAAGYVRRYTSKTTIDCNDNNATVWQWLTGYPDADGDGYYSSTGVSVCSGASLPAGYQSTVGNDCYDSNANAHPGQGNYFPTNRGDGSFDYDCTGVITGGFDGAGQAYVISANNHQINGKLVATPTVCSPYTTWSSGTCGTTYTGPTGGCTTAMKTPLNDFASKVKDWLVSILPINNIAQAVQSWQYGWFLSLSSGSSCLICYDLSGSVTSYCK